GHHHRPEPSRRGSIVWERRVFQRIVRRSNVHARHDDERAQMARRSYGSVVNSIELFAKDHAVADPVPAGRAAEQSEGASESPAQPSRNHHTSDYLASGGS